MGQEKTPHENSREVRKQDGLRAVLCGPFRSATCGLVNSGSSNACTCLYQSNIIQVQGQVCLQVGLSTMPCSDREVSLGS